VSQRLSSTLKFFFAVSVSVYFKQLFTNIPDAVVDYTTHREGGVIPDPLPPAAPLLPICTVKLDVGILTSLSESLTSWGWACGDATAAEATL
jgi:hypothetical protein